MRYALLIYQRDEEWERADEEERRRVYEEHGAFMRLLRERDALRGGEELALSASATTLRKPGDGEELVTDGPYAETTEQLGGFYLVEAPDLDAALELARALPADVVEVRPLVEWEAP